VLVVAPGRRISAARTCQPPLVAAAAATMAPCDTPLASR
jgi:hypothetical protein